MVRKLSLANGECRSECTIMCVPDTLADEVTDANLADFSRPERADSQKGKRRLAELTDRLC